jgi:hypothetical protein
MSRPATSDDHGARQSVASPRLVMMNGVAGAGKSTLAAGLAAALGERAAAVDLIPEEDIFTRSEFAEVGQGFKTQQWPTTDTMLAAYRRVVEAARREQRWVIADWDCVGMIEDLPCARPDPATSNPGGRADMSVLVAHAADVLRLAGDFKPVLLVLSAPHQVAIQRAATERGPEWVARYAAFVQALDPDESLVDRIARWYEDGTPHYADMVDAYRRAGWNVVELDASRDHEHVLRQAMHCCAE